MEKASVQPEELWSEARPRRCAKCGEDLRYVFWHGEMFLTRERMVFKQLTEGVFCNGCYLRYEGPTESLKLYSLKTLVRLM